MKSKDVFYGEVEFWNGNSYGLFVLIAAEPMCSSSAMNWKKATRSSAAIE